MRDPYEVLGVPKGSAGKDVKKAYRKLARDLHPDLRPGDTKAEDRFKDVAAAYDFLSDTNKKARYDGGQIDASGAPRMDRPFYRNPAGSRGSGGGHHDPRAFFGNMEGMDVFSDLFGGMRRAGGRRKAASSRGKDIRHELSMDFLDAVKGASRAIVLPGGKRLKITIPAGSRDGQVLRLKGQGTPGVGGGPAGDVHIELRVGTHPAFTRTENDIQSELPVTIHEAMLGAKIDVPTIDGAVTLTIPKGSNSGTRLRLKGKGAPARGAQGGQGQGNHGRGDQYVTLKVMLPDAPDPDLVRLVEEWARRHPYRVRGGN